MAPHRRSGLNIRAPRELSRHTNISIHQDGDGLVFKHLILAHSGSPPPRLSLSELFDLEGLRHRVYLHLLDWMALRWRIHDTQTPDSKDFVSKQVAAVQRIWQYLHEPQAKRQKPEEFDSYVSHIMGDCRGCREAREEVLKEHGLFL